MTTPISHPLPAGTRVLSRLGLTGYACVGGPLSGVEPTAVGAITYSRRDPHEEWVYEVEFPPGVSAFLSETELGDTTRYEVLPPTPQGDTR
jgi:hypothetical protein